MLHVNAGLGREFAHSHATVEEARECEAEWVEGEAQAAAEIAAERAAERYFESGTEAQQAYRAWENVQEEMRAAMFAF